MIGQVTITTFAVVAAIVLNYLFHFSMTRLLIPSIYGELAFIVGIFTLVMMPPSSIQTLLTREIAKLDRKERKDEITHLIKKYSKLTFLFGLLAGTTLFLSSFVIGEIFNNVRLIPLIQIVSFGVPLVYSTSVVKSYYQGVERFGALSGILVTEPLAKLFIGTTLVLLGFGLAGATVSLWIGALFIGLMLIPILVKRPERRYSASLGKSFFLILLTQVFITFFLYVDLFFVRYHLGSERAAYYNVASITSKVLFYLAGGVVLVFFPKSSKLDFVRDRKEVKILLFKSMLFSVPAFLIFLVFPELIITTFYSAKYLPALTSLKILSFGMFFLALSSLLLHLMWSQRMEILPLLLIAVVVLTDLLLLNHLVPLKGIEGAALATSFTSLLFLILFICVVKNFL